MASLSRFYKPQVDFKYTPQVLEMPVEDMYRLAELKEAKMAKGEKDMSDVLGLLDQAKGLAEIGIGGTQFPIQDKQKMLQEISLLNQEADAIAGKYGNDLSKYGAAREIMDLKRKAVQSLSSGPLFTIGQNVLSVQELEKKSAGITEGYQLLGPLKSTLESMRAGEKKEDVGRYTFAMPEEKLDMDAELLRWQSALRESSIESAGLREYEMKKGDPKQDMFTLTTKSGVEWVKVRDMMISTLGIPKESVQEERDKKGKLIGAKVDISVIDPSKMSFTKVGKAINDSALYETLLGLYNERKGLDKDDPRWDSLTSAIDGLRSGETNPMDFNYEGKFLYRDVVKGYLDRYLGTGPSMTSEKIGIQVMASKEGDGTDAKIKEEFNKPFIQGRAGEQGAITFRETYQNLPGSDTRNQESNDWVSLENKRKDIMTRIEKEDNIYVKRDLMAEAIVYDMAKEAFDVTKDEILAMGSAKEMIDNYKKYKGQLVAHNEIMLKDKYDDLGEEILSGEKEVIRKAFIDNGGKDDDKLITAIKKGLTDYFVSNADKMGISKDQAKYYAGSQLIGEGLGYFREITKYKSLLDAEKLFEADRKYDQFLDSVNDQAITTFAVPSGVVSMQKAFMNKALTDPDISKKIFGDVGNISNRERVLQKMADGKYRNVTVDENFDPVLFTGDITRGPLGDRGFGFVVKKDNAEYIVYPNKQTESEARKHLLQSAIKFRMDIKNNIELYRQQGNITEMEIAKESARQWGDQIQMLSNDNQSYIKYLQQWRAIAKDNVPRTMPIIYFGTDGMLHRVSADISKSGMGTTENYHISLPQYNTTYDTSNFDSFLGILINFEDHHNDQMQIF